ncbi:MAG: purine-nucleoside phosphorylase [Actinomycetota bacterium]|nr:purine-nucleoside phosphorylase [Actinomycetota bacterium]
MPAPTPDPLTDPFGAARVAAGQLAERSGAQGHDVAVILGSGWLAAADCMGEPAAELPVTELAGFLAPSVAGHAGVVRSVMAGRHRVLAFLGRVHLYEGHHPAAVVHTVRTAVMAGCRIVVLTNAAGAINRDYAVGQPVLIADHINLTGQSPLTGPAPPPPFDVRFVDMSAAYSPRLRAAARAVEPSLAEGVYAAFPGPQFETPAEVGMAARLGADLAGMSTVLETIAARHLGAEVLACSLVTNMAAGLEPGGIHHEDVLAVGRSSAEHMGGLLAEMIARL